jgi:hypothetical protein
MAGFVIRIVESLDSATTELFTEWVVWLACGQWGSFQQIAL